MGWMSSPSAPAAPDPQEVAQAQTGANRETAITQYGLQATNQNTPFGSLSYQQMGTWADGTPRFEATTTLSPEQQQLYNQQTRMQSGLMGLGQEQLGRLGGLMSQPFTLDNLQQVNQPQFQQFGGGPNLRTSYNDDFSADRQRVEDAMMGRLNTQLGRDRGSMEQQLANQGVQAGSEAYTNAMSDMSGREQDARTSAILSAGQEQSRLADLARQQASFGNTSQQQMYQNQLGALGANNSLSQQAMQNQMGLRNQGLQEQFAMRNQPLNEIMALMGGGQTTAPNFANTPAPGVAPTNVLGAENMAYQGALNVYNAQMGGNNSMMGGLMGLGGQLGSAAIGAWSDRRLKRDVVEIAMLPNGLPVYSFRYLWSEEPQIGLMADEVERVAPDAVSELYGYKVVDYDALRRTLS